MKKIVMVLVIIAALVVVAVSGYVATNKNGNIVSQGEQGRDSAVCKEALSHRPPDWIMGPKGAEASPRYEEWVKKYDQCRTDSHGVKI